MLVEAVRGESLLVNRIGVVLFCDMLNFEAPVSSASISDTKGFAVTYASSLALLRLFLLQQHHQSRPPINANASIPPTTPPAIAPVEVPPLVLFAPALAAALEALMAADDPDETDLETEDDRPVEDDVRLDEELEEEVLEVGTASDKTSSVMLSTVRYGVVPFPMFCTTTVCPAGERLSTAKTVVHAGVASVAVDSWVPVPAKTLSIVTLKGPLSDFLPAQMEKPVPAKVKL